MLKAPTPKTEKERLEALLQYQVLDSETEQLYDDITSLASELCQTPIALVSLIDGDRQWFKSRHGLDATETPRDVSFCGHAILGNEIFEVKDALKDPRFADNPLVTDAPTVRFYAGAPLKTPEGFNIGTLCVIAHEAHELDKKQKDNLEKLARQVVSQLELRKKNLQLSSKLDELQTAHNAVQGHQEKLIHSAKMASLGEMAGGVAHEINNPLSIIIGHAQKISTLVSRGDKTKLENILPNSIEAMETTAFRIHKIVKGLLNFARESDKKSEVASWKETIELCLGLVQEKFRSKGIELSINDKRDIQLHFSTTPLSQVLINLLNNSAYAIADLETKKISIHLIESEKEVLISVTDNGPGVPKEIQDKVFDPFFTTKPVGDGTGLGLSISKGLIENEGGNFELDTSYTKGARFIITIKKSLSK